MLRYLGFIWDPVRSGYEPFVSALRDSVRSRAGWRAAAEMPGFSLFWWRSESSSMRAINLPPPNCGTVFGAVFENPKDGSEAACRPLYSTNESACAIIASTNGRELFASYWGNYVAFIRDTHSPRVHVLKDPTGSLPCYFSLQHSVAIFFSCLRDFADLNVSRVTINSKYLISRVASGGVDRRFDSLNEVSQVRRGECLALVPDQEGSLDLVRTVCWAPHDFTRPSRLVENPDAATELLRSTARSCTRTHVAKHRQLIVRLSGGLDSSIVLGCAYDRSAPDKLVAYTYYTPHARSSERRWARLAAAHFNVKHVEHPLAPHTCRLDELQRTQQTVEPVSGISYLQTASIERQLASNYAATAVLSGDGGDSGFGGDSIGLSLDDYFQRRGVHFHALRLAEQIAMFRQTTVYAVVAAAARRWIFGSHLKEHLGSFMKSRQLVSQELRAEVLSLKSYPHHWFEEYANVPWRTVFRVGALVYPSEHYDPFVAQDVFVPEEIPPLYSQPVIEACLRIPLDVHFYQGIDRGLARRAFARELPESIRRRQWKDRAPGHFEKLFHTNLPLFRNVLCDGRLVKEKWIDGERLHSALSGTVRLDAVELAELFNHLDVELWIRHFY